MIGFRNWGLGFGVQGVRFMVLGFGVQVLKSSPRQQDEHK